MVSKRAANLTALKYIHHRMEEVRWEHYWRRRCVRGKSGPAFQKCKGSRLSAVMRRTREKAKDFAQRHGVSAFYDTVEGLLSDPNVNAIYIATPPGSHLELALKVLDAKLPTYIEKPVARNAQETKVIVDAFKKLMCLCLQLTIEGAKRSFERHATSSTLAFLATSHQYRTLCYAQRTWRKGERYYHGVSALSTLGAV